MLVSQIKLGLPVVLYITVKLSIYWEYGTQALKYGPLEKLCLRELFQLPFSLSRSVGYQYRNMAWQ